MNRNKISAILNRPYDRLLFGKEILKQVFPTFQQQANLIEANPKPTATEQKSIAKAYLHGNIELSDGTEVLCYEIHLQKQVRIEQSRVNIQHYVRKLVGTGEAALISFVPHEESQDHGKLWRFTLVAKDSEFTSEGVKETATHAKRYTYLVETGDKKSNRTMAERLEELALEKEQDLNKLIKTFSVESLSKEFFNEYKSHYEKFTTELKSINISTPIVNDVEKAKRDFVKKTLGRLIFLYFVQRKNWLGATTTEYTNGDTNFLMHLFEQAESTNADFYGTWLKKLFFETLNTKRPNDDFTMPNGNVVKIPFLNGGLFDGEGIDKEPININPILFHNKKHSEDPKKRGFLDFLNAYNFTVYEDSPDDHTVAVDPEMLGHIFENLLEDNKDKGAFYTPKQIVHYMCTESLLEYLRTNLQGFENLEDLETLVKQKDTNSLTNGQLNEIDQLLDKVTICDPAIGSGAFPMGLLQEIHAIKETISNQIANEWQPATVKKNIIQNSIYGVDLEKGAVDIARLRFWLSLVVDEDEPKPLPNLDYKIMQGNSLLESFEGIDLSNVTNEATQHKEAFDRDLFGGIKGKTPKTFQKQESTEELQALLDEYFSVSSHERKNEIKDEIENHVYGHIEFNIDIRSQDLKKKIKDALSAQRQKEKVGKKLTAKAQKQLVEMQTELNELDSKVIKAKESRQKREKNYFLWNLFFKEVFDKGGFDIVIGNPPYFVYEKEHKKEIEAIKEIEIFEPSFVGKLNAYKLFLCLAFPLSKLGGTINMIFQNSFLGDRSAMKIRELYLNNSKIIRIDSFPERDNVKKRIFESAKMSVCILNATNRKVLDYDFNLTVWDDRLKNIRSQAVFSNKEIAVFDPNTHQFPMISNSEKEIFLAFYNPLKQERLSDVADIFRGELNMTTERKYFIDTPNPYQALKGAQIQRYHITSTPSQGKIEYVDISRFLKDKSSEKSLHHKLSRIITQRITGVDEKWRLKASVSNANMFCADSCNYIIPKKVSSKLLLALLNSKLLNWFFKKNSTNSNVNGYEVEALTIPKKRVSTSIKPIELCVDYILALKKLNIPLNDYVNNEHIAQVFEEIVDALVFELYFPDDFKNANIEFASYVARDCPSIENAASEEEKRDIIHAAYQTLREKDNEIRNNLKRMKIDLRDLIMPILTA